MEDPNEAELLGKAQAGDTRAFGQLVRLHQQRVYACAMQMLGSRSAAEDAAQETFLRAWRAIARFDGRSQLSTWLYRICVNVCLNHLRRRKRPTSDLDDPRVAEPEADPEQGRTDPALALEVSQLTARIHAALDRLTPTLRSAVVLVLLQGLPHREAAEILGCPEGTVAWRIHEARRRMRAELADLMDDDEPAAAGGGT